MLKNEPHTYKYVAPPRQTKASLTLTPSWSLLIMGHPFLWTWIRTLVSIRNKLKCRVTRYTNFSWLWDQFLLVVCYILDSILNNALSILNQSQKETSVTVGETWGSLLTKKSVRYNLPCFTSRNLYITPLPEGKSLHGAPSSLREWVYMALPSRSSAHPSLTIVALNIFCPQIFSEG